MLARPLMIAVATLATPMAWGRTGDHASRTPVQTVSAPHARTGARAHPELAWAQARSLIEASRREGHKKGQTLVFSGKRVHILVVASSPHHPDMSFAAGGLTNPAITVATGALVTITLLNADFGAGMTHSLVITKTAPPYPARPTQLRGAIARLPSLPPRSSLRLAQARYAQTSIQFVAHRTGTYYYICTVPGHAMAFHMYGRFLVARP